MESQKTMAPEWFLITENNDYPKVYDIFPPRSLGGTNPPLKLRTYLNDNRGWSVLLKIHIDSTGKAIQAKCLSESTEMGDLYAEWAKSWRYFPATSHGKPISCIWVIRIPKLKTQTSVVITSQ